MLPPELLKAPGAEEHMRRLRNEGVLTVLSDYRGGERQDELLRAIERTPFFGDMRFATVVGMFSNPSYGGNHDQAGWKLLRFQAHGIYQPPFGYYDAEARKGG